MTPEEKLVDKVKVMIFDMFQINAIDHKSVTQGMSECLINKAYNAEYSYKEFEDMCDKMKEEFKKLVE